jgi:hypothetical protein
LGLKKSVFPHASWRRVGGHRTRQSMDARC